MENKEIKKVNPDNILKSEKFISYLIKPGYVKTYSLLSRNTHNLQEALFTQVLFSIKDTHTDEDIMIKAFKIVRNMLFKETNKKCKFSKCLYTTFVDDPESYVNYTTRFKDKIKIVYDIRSLRGLFDQINILALKQMDPVLTFLNAFYDAGISLSNKDESLDMELMYSLLDCYLDYIFETYAANKDTRFLFPHHCLEKMMEIIKGY